MKITCPFYFLPIFLFLLFSSCRKDTKEAAIEKLMAEWVGKTIAFPQDIPCIFFEKDTVCPDVNTPYNDLSLLREKISNSLNYDSNPLIFFIKENSSDR